MRPHRAALSFFRKPQGKSGSIESRLNTKEGSFSSTK